MKKTKAVGFANGFDNNRATEHTSLFGTPINHEGARRTLSNFILMSVIFSACPSCAIACLSLASARLGSLGVLQSGTLYLTYSISAFVATYVVKRLGARNGMIAGMALYCVYVGCFLVATTWNDIKYTAALSGAVAGGIGSSFAWTAQGSYFSRAAEEHALFEGCAWSKSTSKFAGIFAAIFLAEEAFLDLLSTALVQYFQVPWNFIFGIYATIAIISTIAMNWVHNYPPEEDDEKDVGIWSAWNKFIAAWRMLREDSKMKYMIGLNAAFGFAAAFLNSYVSGVVIRVVLADDSSKFVGVFAAWCQGVAALMSLIFANVAQRVGKGPVLTFGALAFAFVAIPFLVQPNLEEWGWGMLLFVYTCQGTGRATFEGTLKATFADFFAYEKEGAFANIILQNGLASSFGFILAAEKNCSSPSTFCVQYSDGSLHDVLSFELLVVVTSLVAIYGYWKASALFQAEQQQEKILGKYHKCSVSSYRRISYNVKESGSVDLLENIPKEERRTLKSIKDEERGLA